MTLRFFFAHQKAMAADEITNARVAIVAWMKARQPTAEITLISGRDDFDQHFKRCGSWDAWALDVAAGVSYATREPRFHGIIVPGRVIGAATARICSAALEAGKPVWIWEGAKLTKWPGKIDRVGPNFKDGWRLS